MAFQQNFETVQQLSVPLIIMFKVLLKRGIVPGEWREASIIPLFKEDSRNISDNYRPFTLNSLICIIWLCIWTIITFTVYR